MVVIYGCRNRTGNFSPKDAYISFLFTNMPFFTNNSDIFVEDLKWKKFSRWIMHGVSVINVTGFRKLISDTNAASERRASKTLLQLVRLYANRERCVCSSVRHVA